MKNLCVLFTAIIISTCAMAQAPDKMSYQAVIRDAGNALVTDQTVGMRISILQGSLFGASVYVETQTPTTNMNGLVSVEIGSGTVVTGAFNTIDWNNGPYFIKTETDPAGGTDYTITGTSELLSVPYALHARTADSVVDNYAWSTADFDSDWFTMNSQAGTASFKEVVHGLGSYPSRVLVLTRATSGNNNGYIFHGMGGAQIDDDNNEYGGLVYAYNDMNVRLWAPDLNNYSPHGYIIFVGDGWGGEVSTTALHSADVRVLCWK